MRISQSSRFGNFIISMIVCSSIMLATEVITTTTTTVTPAAAAPPSPLLPPASQDVRASDDQDDTLRMVLDLFFTAVGHGGATVGAGSAGGRWEWGGRGRAESLP